jgi:hypothetical protein
VCWKLLEQLHTQQQDVPHVQLTLRVVLAHVMRLCDMQPYDAAVLLLRVAQRFPTLLSNSQVRVSAMNLLLNGKLCSPFVRVALVGIKSELS